jgi:hypothetical protein
MGMIPTASVLAEFGDEIGRKRPTERQTVYLRALRDSTKVQVETFLSGLLDHVTSEYGPQRGRP